VVARWTEMARGWPVTGGRVFDLQLAATMLGNGVGRIYTYNTSDFEGLGTIDAIPPPTVAVPR
jgi:hypothetical protein